MQAAADLLGAELFPGESGDGELADDPPWRRWLVEVYRRFRPDLVLAHAPTDYHTDHRAASALAEAASWYCASLGHVTASPALSAQPALWWLDEMNMGGFRPHFYIDISAYLDLKRRLLACHASQLQRSADGDFSPLDQQMVRQCQMRGSQAGVAAAEAFRIHRVWKRLRAW
jgi:LmbE family N-acetylglucosaminyl deacetylase